jgi:hypothetical protein
MPSSIFVSILLHVIIIALGVYGLPVIKRTSFEQEIPMVVEIVPMALTTNIPFVSKLGKKPPKKKIKAKKKPSVIKEKKVSAPLSMPKKEREIVPVPPPPKPKPKTKPRVELIKKPKTKLKAKTKLAQVRQKLSKVRPQRKPKPPDRFAMVLKNLEKDFKISIPKKKQIAKKKIRIKSDLMARLSKSLSKQPTEFDVEKRVTMNERHAMINAVKKKMEPCWNFQAGSKKAQDIIVEIQVKLRPNGYVLDAIITNKSELTSDPFKKAAGESALRAVLNPSCQPYSLPVNRYDVWKDIKLTFNPKEMLGR